MLIDEVKIKISAGRGGDGIVAFDKVKMSLGPTGGRGGKGGSVFFEGVSDIFALKRYRHQKVHLAEDGRRGRAQKADGPAGKDLVLLAPIGTVITDLKTGEQKEIAAVGERILLAKGGFGGRGNFYFRSSRNTTPKEAEIGQPGEEKELNLELKLIADIGLIGLPSAGKSSLLNALTKAQVKIGAYHFTTLEPNLGNLDGLILADIPGLIEGSSKGRGLGIKFLRHIQRTRALAHLISLESDDLEKDYKIIRKELEAYNRELLKKPEILVFTKVDLFPESLAQKKVKKFLKKNKKEVLVISINDPLSLEKLKAAFKEALR